jgi:hypothetical protein
LRPTTWKNVARMDILNRKHEWFEFWALNGPVRVRRTIQEQSEPEGRLHNCAGVLGGL